MWFFVVVAALSLYSPWFNLITQSDTNTFTIAHTHTHTYMHRIYMKSFTRKACTALDMIYTWNKLRIINETLNKSTACTCSVQRFIIIIIVLLFLFLYFFYSNERTRVGLVHNVNNSIELKMKINYKTKKKWWKQNPKMANRIT